MKILIVEDELELSRSICSYLKAENYICEMAVNFQEAVDKVGGYDYDCIILDIGLPDGNGLNVLRELKKEKRTEGVIIVSAKGSLDSRIDGLNLGADDYLAKPFHLSELSARISAVIRRRRFDGSNNIVINDLLIDTVAKTVFFGDKAIDLTKKEYDLLLYLAVNRNRLVSKTAIAEHLSGDNADYFDNFDFIYAHIKNLKKKIAASNAKDPIKTMYGMGYKLQVD
ncbi:MAG: response regulator transcription factor [Paludibacteraceae bacterium]